MGWGSEREVSEAGSTDPARRRVSTAFQILMDPRLSMGGASVRCVLGSRTLRAMCVVSAAFLTVIRGGKCQNGLQNDARLKHQSFTGQN